VISDSHGPETLAGLVAPLAGKIAIVTNHRERGAALVFASADSDRGARRRRSRAARKASGRLELNLPVSMALVVLPEHQAEFRHRSPLIRSVIELF
jgi:hypothetical protein